MHRALSAPTHRQCVHRCDVDIEQSVAGDAVLQHPCPQHPGAHRGRQGRQGFHARLVVVDRSVGGSRGPVVKGTIVLGGQGGGAGQIARQVGAQGFGQGGHGGANSGTRIGEVGVVRVVPDLQALLLAGLSRVMAAHVQQRTPQPSAPARHPRQPAWTGPARKPEQHRLGLIVASVPKHDRGGVVAAARGLQSRVTRSASGGFGPAVGDVDVDRGDLDGVEACAARPVGDCRGLSRGACLHTVIDGHQARSQTRSRSDEGHGSGQRRRIRTSRTRREHRGAARQICKAVAHCDTQQRRGTRRPRTHGAATRSIQRVGSAMSSMVGRLDGLCQTWLRPSMPTVSTTDSTN